VGGLFAGLTQIIQSIGPAIGGLVAGVLGTWAAITTVSTVLRQVQRIGGIEPPQGDTTLSDDDTEEEEEDDDGEDVIEADDLEDWYWYEIHTF
jgi:hypothetical protein